MQANTNSKPIIQAKKTWYNGVEYRSALEAKTAQTLDILGIDYEYEPKGYKLSNGLWYRPDFWLPYAKQFIECKGEMKAKDSAKICGLVESTGAPVVVIGYENVMIVELWEAYFDNQWNNEIITFSGEDIMLGWCKRCGMGYFYAESASYRCTACGFHDGDRTVNGSMQVISGTNLFNIGQEIAAETPLFKTMADNFNK